MINRLITYVLAIFLPAAMMSQQVEHVTIDWSSMQSVESSSGAIVNYYTFDRASNLLEFGSLPVYVSELPAPPQYFEYQTSINITKSDTLDSSTFQKLTDLMSITGQPEIRTRLGSKTRVYILPFYNTDDGKVVRLTTFDLVYDLVPTDNQEPDSSTGTEYSESSVLSAGTWYKVGVLHTGIQKITWSDLQNAGIDPGQIDPMRLGIFGNYNGMLPEDNGKPRIDDLVENAILVKGEEDGTFDPDDYILFYAQAGTTWKYNIFTGRINHSKNLYADTSYFFLTTDAGTHQRIQTLSSVGETPTEIVTSYYDYAAHENDLFSLMHSGREWYGEEFSVDTSERTFSFEFPNMLADRAVYLNFEMVARGAVNTYAEVYANDQLVIDSTKFSKLANSSAVHASKQNRTVTFFADKDKLDLKVKYYTDDPLAKGWLNYIVLNAERALSFTGGQMPFMNPHVSAAGNITRYEISNVDQAVSLWDISYPFRPFAVEYALESGELHFTVTADTLRNFIIFDDAEFFSPVEIIPVSNQNLHGISNINFVIIAPEQFVEQANRLAALHKQADGLETIVVTDRQVYNEFSSGSQDIAAIRDFMRMLYKRGNFGSNPGYLLLFGDASFDFRHRIPGNTNIIPSYQSDESRIETKSFVTDDFFGLLDDNEGLNSSGNLDIGIGRFPVSTIEDATTAVDKIEHYLSKNEEVMKPWRTNICFVADDGDQNLHFKQANYLIGTLDTVLPVINTNKIFSDAYTKIHVPGGKRFPEVNQEINRQVEEGSLIVNYTGHGGLIGWSDEKILDVPTIREYDNINNMPLFITATCEFSRFDNPEFVSAGEYLFLNEKGGGVALLTTTRLAFAAANIIVNQRIYQHFSDRGDGERPRIGDMIRLSKNPSNESFLNFALLGDPALRLAYPKYNIITSHVNNRLVENNVDTIHALSIVNVSGMVTGENGEILDNFDGILYTKVFDKPTQYMTLGTENDSYPAEFDLMDKVLFDGKTTVKKGKFSFSFLVPKDISYNYGFGKISYYAVDTVQMEDAWGAYNNLYIGGLDDQAEPDNTGPEIVMYMNDKSFSSGDPVSKKSYLFANLFDENGIQSTGQSLGRDITLVLDEDYSNTMVVNEFFDPDLDTYKSGSLSYYFDDLSDGWHTLSIKAWDLQNNSSTASIEFYVDENAPVELAGVINYPNPFTEETYFNFNHNKNGSILDVEIDIYDINGRFVTQLKDRVASNGNYAQPIYWDGTNQNGSPLPTGIYSYQIIVTDYLGNTSMQRQKLIKIGE